MPASILLSLSSVWRAGAPPTGVIFRSSAESPSALAILIKSLLEPSVSDSTPILAPRKSAKVLIEGFAIRNSGVTIQPNQMPLCSRATSAMATAMPPAWAAFRLSKTRFETSMSRLICPVSRRCCGLMGGISIRLL